MGKVMAVCISKTRGVQKKDIGSARFLPEWGLDGDAHGGDWHRQVSLLSYDKIRAFNALGADVDAGAFGENLVVAGIDFKSLPIGTRLECGDVLLEITQIGKECHNRCQIYDKMGDCIMPREGVFARVLKSGVISVGDEMSVIEEMGKVRVTAAVLIASDKASSGAREDESGKLIAAMLEEAGYEVTETLILPDEQAQIETELKRLADNRRVSLILTTGGTGFSQRDITPEATLAVATRFAPGIAEAIRSYSLTITKRAMLSRGVSVIRGETLIVNLPGSPKAVRESLSYILPELGHGLDVLCGNDFECAAQDKQS